MKGINKQFMSWCCIATLSGSLLACTSNPNADLKAYVEKVKSQQTAKIDPLPEFKPYESFAYQADDLRDPFTEPTYSHPQAVASQSTNSGIKPDFDRPTEPLEEFPLDSLRMVGTLEQNEHNWALINDTDGTIHRVEPGNYAGQNHGKITRVTEFEVELTEIVPDGIGGWMERQASIAISE
jgi:type IV pilus assembly protein PilP